MRTTLSPDVHLLEDASDIPLSINMTDESNYLHARCDAEKGDIYLSFSSRVAMYDFARSLLHQSVYGESGWVEFFPLGSDEKLHIVDGVRMSLDSSRIFVEYPSET